MTKIEIVVLAAVCLVPGVLRAEVNWSCVTDAPEWTSRTSHASVVFDGKMWLFGGCTPAWPDTGWCDVWCSADGEHWDRVCDSAPWGPRCDFAATVHNGRMWLLGGWDVQFGTLFNDVWSSIDGDSWVLETGSAGWMHRSGHTATTYNGTMWVMGGFAGSGFLRDVWCSEDGVNWTMTCNTGNWNARQCPSVAVHRDTMWLAGGLCISAVLNDVWYSVDGETWTQATGEASWTPRQGHGLVSYLDKLWVIGGATDGLLGRVNDVWYSDDGVDWRCECQSAEWRPRAWQSTHVLRDTMWLVGGDSLEQCLSIGEVWRSAGQPGVAEQREESDGFPCVNHTVARGVLNVPAGQNAVLLDISGRKVADLLPGRNDVRHVCPGVYFVCPKRADGAVAGAGRKVVVTR